MSLFVDLSLSVVLWLLGFGLPGWLLLRAIGLRPNLAAAFALSVAVLYQMVVVFALTGVALSRGTGVAALSLICAALAIWSHYWPSAPVPAQLGNQGQAAPRWMWLPLAAAVGLFAWRALTQPLPGPDFVFRWNLLPLQMLETGGLDFYPPRVLADFERYFYFDGFPPLVATAYWWSYLSLGSTASAAAGLVAVAQYTATLALTAQAVTALSDARHGRLAAVILAGAPLFFWSSLIGQETGWIALSLAATLWGWTQSRRPHSRYAIGAVALALSLSLTAREYGPALLIVGLLLGLGIGAKTRALVGCGLGAVALAAPWYTHVWLRCGNPFYSLSPGGIFPVNPVGAGIYASYVERFPPWHYRPGYLLFSAWDLLRQAPLVWGFGLAGGVALVGRFWSWLAALAVLVALWAASVGYTSAGSLQVTVRVLAPALILCAALGALWLWQAKIHASLRSAILVMVVLLSVHGLWLAGVVPADAWDCTLRTWWAGVKSGPAAESKPATPAVLSHALPGGSRVLSDNAYLHAMLVQDRSPIHAVPVWAPEFAFLFQAGLTPADAAQRLRQLGVAAVNLDAASPNTPYLERFGFFSTIVKGWPRVPGSTAPTFYRVPE